MNKTLKNLTQDWLVKNIDSWKWKDYTNQNNEQTLFHVKLKNVDQKLINPILNSSLFIKFDPRVTCEKRWKLKMERLYQSE
jgi:3-phenylpropionate/cinnamic acid dioxygenase small subunit